jgi:hypothetical protein
MCEFCISHGDGKKWYRNMTYYTRELFLQVDTEMKLKNYLNNFARSM